MWGWTGRRDAPAGCTVRALQFATFLSIAVAFALGGCSSSGFPGALSGVSGQLRTVAFESIDGPPETVFKSLVRELNQEAQARQVSVVSRESAAQYRIRGYVAAHVQGKKTTISWVWDVYDADRQRAMRLTGEEVGTSGRTAWNAADDQVLNRIAREGMTRLAAFLENPPTPDIAPSAPPAQKPPNVAFLPAQSGILAYAPTGGGSQ
jgi:hypothetical protein